MATSRPQMTPGLSSPAARSGMGGQETNANRRSVTPSPANESESLPTLSQSAPNLLDKHKPQGGKLTLSVDDLKAAVKKAIDDHQKRARDNFKKINAKADATVTSKGVSPKAAGEQKKPVTQPKQSTLRTKEAERTAAEWRKAKDAADLKIKRDRERAEKLKAYMAQTHARAEEEKKAMIAALEAAARQSSQSVDNLKSITTFENVTRSAPNLPLGQHWSTTMIQSGTMAAAAGVDSKQDQSQQVQRDKEQGYREEPDYDASCVDDLLYGEEAGAFQSAHGLSQPPDDDGELVDMPSQQQPAAAAGAGADAAKQPAITGEGFRLWRKGAGVLQNLAQTTYEAAAAQLGIKK